MQRLQQGYLAGLLSGLSSLRQMIAVQFISLSLAQSSRLMRTPQQERLWQEVLKEIPAGGYLAIDYLKVAHEGIQMEGVDRELSPQGIMWGHRYLTSSIVFSDRDEAYPLRADASLSRRMATKDYPYLNPSEAMLNVVGDVLLAGYEAKGVVVDAEFTSKLVLRSLPHFPAGIVGRFRSNTKVVYDGQEQQARVLASQYPPGRSRYYPKLGCYAKRLKVMLKHVGMVDLIFLWFADEYGWKLSVLVSTVTAGVQELVKAYKSRWKLEVIHRSLKQNLSLVKCQCLAFAAQLRHINWAFSALRLVYQYKRLHPHLTLREAQQAVARDARNALLTDVNASLL